MIESALQTALSAGIPVLMIAGAIASIASLAIAVRRKPEESTKK